MECMLRKARDGRSGACTQDVRADNCSLRDLHFRRPWRSYAAKQGCREQYSSMRHDLPTVNSAPDQNGMPTGMADSHDQLAAGHCTRAEFSRMWWTCEPHRIIPACPLDAVRASPHPTELNNFSPQFARARINQNFLRVSRVDRPLLAFTLTEPDVRISRIRLFRAGHPD